MTPTLSVIIPTYFAENSIERLIESIYNQKIDQKLLELIIIDDCSLDRTYKQIKIALKKYLFEKTIVKKLKKNSGNGVVKNLGIRLANSEYILFLDDHLYLEDRFLFKKVLDFFSKYPADAVCGHYCSSYKNDWNSIRDLRRSYLYKKQERRELTLRDWSTFSIVLGAGKASLFKSLPFPNNFGQNSAEDTWWQLIATSMGYRLFFSPNITAFHDHNLSFRSFIKKIFIEIRGLGDLLFQFHREKGKNVKYLPHLEYFLDYDIALLIILFVILFKPILGLIFLVLWYGLNSLALYLKVKNDSGTDFYQKVVFSLFLPLGELVKVIFLPFFLLLKYRSISLVKKFAIIALVWSLNSKLRNKYELY